VGGGPGGRVGSLLLMALWGAARGTGDARTAPPLARQLPLPSLPQAEGHQHCLSSSRQCEVTPFLLWFGRVRVLAEYPRVLGLVRGGGGPKALPDVRIGFLSSRCSIRSQREDRDAPIGVQRIGQRSVPPVGRHFLQISWDQRCEHRGGAHRWWHGPSRTKVGAPGHRPQTCEATKRPGRSPGPLSCSSVACALSPPTAGAAGSRGRSPWGP
jgi:hypothetical protein